MTASRTSANKRIRKLAKETLGTGYPLIFFGNQNYQRQAKASANFLGDEWFHGAAPWAL
jgi:hypothetical protein